MCPAVDTCQNHDLFLPLALVYFMRVHGAGVVSLRVNRFMNADPPSFEPYKVFDYSENFDHAEDDGIDDKAELNNNTLVATYDVAISCPVFHDMMERILSGERHTIMVLRHDVKHQNIINLLRLLEDAQCPDYMLQQILQWACNAKSEGFDFNPKAT